MLVSSIYAKIFYKMGKLWHMYYIIKLIFIMYEESLESNNKRMNDPTENESKI